MNELISQGFVFMCVGMLVVFGFLLLLVFAMRSMAGFLKRYAHLFPEEEPAESNLKRIATDYAEVAVAVAVAEDFKNRGTSKNG